MLAKGCLRVMSTTLKEDVCHHKDPGVLFIDVIPDKLRQRIPPEAQYACRYWIEHNEKSGAPFNSEVFTFLQTHFLHWLEAMTWMGKLSQAILSITSLERSVSVSLSSLSSG